MKQRLRHKQLKFQQVIEATVGNRAIAAILVALLAVPAPPVAMAEPEPPQSKVSVVPGAPNVWSLEQAHYLLNKLRANRDGLQMKMPGPDDLDPNAINGMSIDALQTFLGAAATYDQIVGTTNAQALSQYQTALGRNQTQYGRYLSMSDLADQK